MILSYFLVLILLWMLLSLCSSLISEYRDLRDMKEIYKEKYGREYSDDPSQTKKAFIKLCGFLGRFIGLTRKFDK